MICTIEYLRPDFDWIMPSDSSRRELCIDSPVSFRRRAVLGSLTDDSATTAPKLNNCKKVQWTSFLLDGFLNYMRGKKIENQMLSKEFFYLLCFCLSLCFIFLRGPSRVAWAPCGVLATPTALFLFLCCPLSSLLGLGIESITQTTEQMLSIHSCFIFAWFLSYILFSLPTRSWLLRVQVKSRIHPDFNMLAMTHVLLSSLNQGSV